jgi:hypothetical protein
MADPRQPRRRLGGQPAGHRGGAASRQNIDQPARVEIEDPGHQQPLTVSGGGQERRLVQSDRLRGAQAGEVIDPGPAVIAHRRHGRVPRDTEVAGRLGDRVLIRSDPTGDLGAGPLGEHRPRAIASDSSDHVRIGQVGSGQRHRRLAHTSTTGLSASGRSRTTTRRRPWPTTRTPQAGHQARSSVVSTASHHSPDVSSSSKTDTTNPSSPSRADTPLPSRSIRGLLSM